MGCTQLVPGIRAAPGHTMPLLGGQARAGDCRATTSLKQPGVRVRKATQQLRS